MVESGNQLNTAFTKLREFASKFFQTHFETDADCLASRESTSVAADFALLKEHLSRFDYLWAEYERKYVNELMVIEGDARRYIIESINLEAVLG